MAAEARLRAERKSWRQDHPFNFVAKPVTKPDGSQNLFEWDCKVRCHGTGNLTRVADAAACVPADSGEGVVGMVPWNLPWEAVVHDRVSRAAAHVQVLADRRQAALSPERLQRWQDLHVDHQPTRIDARVRSGRKLVRVRDDQAGAWHRPIRHSECRLTLPTRPARAAPQVLQAVQMFLDESTSRAAGREEAYNLYNNNRAEYNKRVKQQVARVEAVPGA